MRHEVIPAILADSKKDFFQKLTSASLFSKKVQIDIMDGLFVKNKTPRDLNNGRWFAEFLLNPPEQVPDIELHLMVEDPWSIIREWHEYLELKRVIWHVEVPIEHGEMIEMAHEFRIAVGLAVSPGTPIRAVFPFISPVNKRSPEFVDEVLVMGVIPGKSGQKFLPEALKAIRGLRSKFPKLEIGVDGGINSHNIKALASRGVTRFYSAGAVLLAKDPKIAYRDLTNIIKS